MSERKHKALKLDKRMKLGRAIVLCVAVAGTIQFLAVPVGNDKPANTTTNTAVTVDAVPEYIFRDGNGYPIDLQAMTNAWATEAGYVKRYELTDAERWEIASVVTAEAEGEPFAGKMAVAQCILQAIEDDGISPFEAVKKYKYAKSRPEPTEEALEAVRAVFDFGHVATAEPIKYFYAKALVNSPFHESQDFVMEINGHRFFAEVK